jgi:3-oxoacyl-[acyl-carrier-protein] synthase-3
MEPRPTFRNAEPLRQRGEIASIASIAYHLGQLKPIDEIDFLREDPRKLELYRLAGFDSYAESDLSMRELAYRSAVRTLEDSHVQHSEIGVCIYVAESFGRDEVVNSAEVNRLLIDLGLDRAVPIHVSVSNCANIMSALRIATALIAAGDASHVLIVSVDKASRRPGGRRMYQEMSIKSDVSLSCLVSAPGAGSYGILYIGQNNAAGLIGSEALDSKTYAISKFNGIRRSATQAREALALGAADFKWIVTSNYGREVTKMFVELCGFGKDASRFGNTGRFGHAVAGDVLINLRDLETEGEIKPGDRIFLMADSITSSSVLCLQRR